MKKILFGLILMGSSSAISSIQCSSLCVHYIAPFEYKVIGDEPVTASSFEELAELCRERVSISLNIEKLTLTQANPNNFGIGAGDENITFFPKGGTEI